MHVVLRPFYGADGRRFEKGERVDASEWRWVNVLIDQRYLRPLLADEASVPASAVADAISGRRQRGRPRKQPEA